MYRRKAWSTNDLSAFETSTEVMTIQNWSFSGSNDAIQLSISGGDTAPGPQSKSSMGALGTMFARLTGGKVLAKEDLEPVLSAMKDHLMKKNVAKEIADKICDGVGRTLIGKRIGGFQCTLSDYLLVIVIEVTLQRSLPPSAMLCPFLSLRFSPLRRQPTSCKLYAPNYRHRFHQLRSVRHTRWLSLA